MKSEMKLVVYTFIINLHLLVIIHCEPLLYRSLNLDYAKKENLNKERNETDFDDGDGVEFRFYRLNYNKPEESDTELNDNKTDFHTADGDTFTNDSVYPTLESDNVDDNLILINDSNELTKIDGIDHNDINNSKDITNEISTWPNNNTNKDGLDTDSVYENRPQYILLKGNNTDKYTEINADYMFNNNISSSANDTQNSYITLNNVTDFFDSSQIPQTYSDSDSDSDTSFEVTTPSADVIVRTLSEDRKRFLNRSELWPVKRTSEMPGELILGGLMMVHEREDTVICGPVMPQGGIQALETMLYTLDVINADESKPFALGAHILDDCDKDTYGLEMAVDFIRDYK